MFAYNFGTKTNGTFKIGLVRSSKINELLKTLLSLVPSSHYYSHLLRADHQLFSDWAKRPCSDPLVVELRKFLISTNDLPPTWLVAYQENAVQHKPKILGFLCACGFLTSVCYVRYLFTFPGNCENEIRRALLREIELIASNLDCSELRSDVELSRLYLNTFFDEQFLVAHSIRHSPSEDAFSFVLYCKGVKPPIITTAHNQKRADMALLYLKDKNKTLIGFYRLFKEFILIDPTTPDLIWLNKKL